MASLVRTNLRRNILIGATLALSIGTSMTAFAQPGASFQTRSQREADGLPAVPSLYSRTKHPPEAYREWDGFSPPGFAWYRMGAPTIGFDTIDLPFDRAARPPNVGITRDRVANTAASNRFRRVRRRLSQTAAVADITGRGQGCVPGGVGASAFAENCGRKMLNLS